MHLTLHTAKFAIFLVIQYKKMYWQIQLGPKKKSYLIKEAILFPSVSGACSLSTHIGYITNV